MRKGRRRRRGGAALSATAIAAVALLAVRTGSAVAVYTAPLLVSASPTLQADYAYSPAISADGRYVAFTGSVASVPGIYRKDLSSGTLELVARGDAGAPSISADGRYVSFTAAEDPATGGPTTPSGGVNPGECASVYVRDMDRGETQAGVYAPAAFTLASARDGSDESLTYKGSATQGCPGGGAVAADRVALSANGRRVAFTVVGESDLTQASGVTSTPPDQVAMRDLDTKRTTLISATLASEQSATPQPVPLGAALAGSRGPIQTDSSGKPISAGTAALSADGSTVAWMGVNIPEQAPVGPAGPGVKEQYGYVEAHNLDRYAEPLWRRIADGPSARTQRVLAEDDPSSPAGISGPLNLGWDPMDTQGSDRGPLYGSYVILIGFDNTAPYQSAAEQPNFASVTPQLSADGSKVALLSTAPAQGAEPVYPTSHPSTVPANVLLVDMHSGLTRAQAIRPLTAWAATNFGSDPAATAPIGDLAISPDGTRVAFTTIRTLFPLAPPELITPQVSSASFAQLYEADMRADTLSLVSQGYDQSPAQGNVYTPAFDGDGNTLAFASSARNLIYGAANPGASNVFAISTLASPEAAGQQSVTALPAPPPEAPAWRISATIKRGPKGSLLIDAIVPVAGSLSASASAAVPAAAHGGKGRGRNGRRHSRQASLSTRVVAGTHATTTVGGLIELRLKPAGRYRSLLRGRSGLYAKIALSFQAPGHRRLTEVLRASFREVPPRRHG
jgi:WD40-like Beta Propeller Repeat